MIKGIHHIAIGVPDLNAGMAFYTAAFGFEVLQRSTLANMPLVDQAIGLTGVDADMAMLKTANCFIELWQYRSPDGRDTTSRPCDLGYPHFAVEVEDIDSEYKRLMACGMRFVGEPVDFGDASAVYGQDPFGNTIEIYEIRNPEKPRLNAGHGL
ncbi:MAG: VOC family protein [Pseudomonadales bacterium]